MQVSSHPLEFELFGPRALSLARLFDPIDTDLQPHARLGFDLKGLSWADLLFDRDRLLGGGIQILNFDEHFYAFLNKLRFIRTRAT
jgi:hypothetical protein